MDNFEYGMMVVFTILVVGFITGAYLALKGASIDVLYAMFLGFIVLAFYLIWRKHRSVTS